MTDSDGPNPGAPLTDVLVEISKRVVADRLEAILPGLENYATERAARARQRRDEITARRHPGTTSPVFPPEVHMLNPDYLLEHARLHARIDSDHLGEGQMGIRSDSIARRVLRGLTTLQEDVLTVSHLQRCFRIPAAYLIEFVLHGAGTTGDMLLDGDDLFVCARSPRVIVVHHEGRIFEVNA